jgi:endonuclease-3
MKKSERIVRILDVLKKEQDANTMLGDMGGKYDAFKILISTILSARSRDEVTYPLCEELFKKYPNAKVLANANPKDIEKMLKRIGFYKQKTRYIINTAKMIVENKGQIPDSIEKLVKFPGVGRKVAGCVVVYAHGKDAIPVDTHVHRLSNRIGLVKTKNPEKTEIELMKITPKKYWQLVNDLFVWYGKNLCKPITPECYRCKIIKLCGYKKKNL